jgi:hypothetical protein
MRRVNRRVYIITTKIISSKRRHSLTGPRYRGRRCNLCAQGECGWTARSCKAQPRQWTPGGRGTQQMTAWTCVRSPPTASQGGAIPVRIRSRLQWRGRQGNPGGRCSCRPACGSCQGLARRFPARVEYKEYTSTQHPWRCKTTKKHSPHSPSQWCNDHGGSCLLRPPSTHSGEPRLPPLPPFPPLPPLPLPLALFQSINSSC